MVRGPVRKLGPRPPSAFTPRPTGGGPAVVQRRAQGDSRGGLDGEGVPGSVCGAARAAESERSRTCRSRGAGPHALGPPFWSTPFWRWALRGTSSRNGACRPRDSPSIRSLRGSPGSRGPIGSPVRVNSDRLVSDGPRSWLSTRGSSRRPFWSRLWISASPRAPRVTSGGSHPTSCARLAPSRLRRVLTIQMLRHLRRSVLPAADDELFL